MKREGARPAHSWSNAKNAMGQRRSGAGSGCFLDHNATDHRQLDAVGRVDHVPEHDAEYPGHAPDALDDRDDPGRTPFQLLTAPTHPASPSGLDILQPIRLAPEVEPDHDLVVSTKRPQRRMTYDS